MQVLYLKMSSAGLQWEGDGDTRGEGGEGKSASTFTSPGRTPRVATVLAGKTQLVIYSYSRCALIITKVVYNPAKFRSGFERRK